MVVVGGAVTLLLSITTQKIRMLNIIAVVTSYITSEIKLKSNKDASQ